MTACSTSPVAIFSATGLPDAAVILGKIILGDYAADAHAYSFKARRVRIDADPPQKVQLDGGASGETAVEIEVIPGALKVICPRVIGLDLCIFSKNHDA